MAGRKSATDPTRSLGLLWGSPARPGRSGLTVAAIVTSAVELADAEGLDAVSMRRVAERLGVGTMSLYTHVPTKTDLTELMMDATLGQLYEDPDQPATATGGWRGALTLVAERNWGLYRAHPWLLDVGAARPVLGPHTTAKYEAELRPLDGLGLSEVEMDSVLALVLTHVAGTARALVDVERTRRDSGLTDAQWWSVVGPVLDRLVDRHRYPVATRVGEAAAVQYDAASDPVHALSFGLDRILDGVAALVDSRRPPGGGPRK